MNFHLQKAVSVLHRGGVIAYPTEGVWGLGCDPFNAQAVRRVLSLKHRSGAKGLILIAGHLSQVESWLQDLPEDIQRKISDSWPGPHTWIIPATDQIPEWIRGQHPTVAVRVTDHPLVQQLCLKFGGPLVSTSANHSGHRAATNQLQVQCWFGKDVDYVLPGKTLGRKGPSSIHDALTGKQLR